MASVAQTVQSICAAPTFDARIAEIRKIPGRHGTDDWKDIFAAIARELYVPDLTPDFAYIHTDDFYSEAHFERAYRAAANGTDNFNKVDLLTLAHTLEDEPTSLLAFRVIAGLTREEFAHSVKCSPGCRGMTRAPRPLAGTHPLLVRGWLHFRGRIVVIKDPQKPLTCPPLGHNIVLSGQGKSPRPKPKRGIQ